MTVRSAQPSIASWVAGRVRSLPVLRSLSWRYVVVGIVDAADEIPEKLSPRTAIVVQSAARPMWIAFDCPRHHTERIMLNLSRARIPSWRIQPTARVSVHPSVDALHAGERCHFWLADGRIKWVKNIVRDSDERISHVETQ